MATGSNSKRTSATKLKAKSKCGEIISKPTFSLKIYQIFFRKNENIETEYSLLILFYFIFFFILTKFRTKKTLF
jgi:hypothetical protein